MRLQFCGRKLLLRINGQTGDILQMELVELRVIGCRRLGGQLVCKDFASAVQRRTRAYKHEKAVPIYVDHMPRFKPVCIQGSWS